MAATTSTPVALLALVVMATGQGLAVPSLGPLALATAPVALLRRAGPQARRSGHAVRLEQGRARG